MRNLVFDLNKEPDCLKALRNNNSSYDDLKDDCRGEVLSILKKSQQNYCAYCEKLLQYNINIEHIIPQSVDRSKDLMLENYLGVCSGHFYLNKMRGTKIDHCDKSRQIATPLHLNPKIKADIDQIYYDDDASILSKNINFNNDLNTQLNLNFDQLKLQRQDVFNNNLKQLISVSSSIKMSKTKAYCRALRSGKLRTTEFSGYLIFRYKKLLMNSVSDSIGKRIYASIFCLLNRI